ncbi:hypothetical protein LTR62_005718 [Meristemomyces frigidus]|uniref:Uncharacterized protein n=1 Tax=Meristemomyces frigidus TaxID=1508187 RepID=A0AAN7YQC4_9PEZI|nr:hypothetical protein LTR62_005718 [Meristemomyces frigidus]
MFGWMISDFWTHFVPHRCRRSVVLKALVAFGKLHRNFVEHAELTEDERCRTTSEAMASYFAAITELRRYTIAESMLVKADVPLACLILICCELLGGTCDDAIAHLDKGTAVLCTWAQEIEASESRRSTNRSQEELDFAKIGEAFAALEIHAVAYNDARVPVLGDLCLLKPSRVQHKLLVSESFSSPREAQSSLVRLVSIALQDLTSTNQCVTNIEVPQVVLAQRESLLAKYSRWLFALSDLESREAVWSPATSRSARGQQRIVAAMRLQHLTLQCLLEQSLDDPDRKVQYGSSSFDKHAKYLLHWPEIAINTSSSQPVNRYASSCKPLRRTFSDDLGLSPLLRLLAFKTKDVSTQDDAVALLSGISRLQGWFDPKS